MGGIDYFDYSVHKCEKCQNLTSLPSMGGKECPNCGTRQPTIEELEARFKQDRITCKECGKVTDLIQNKGARYCYNCRGPL